MLLCPNCHSQTDTYAGRNSNRTNNTTSIKTKKTFNKCNFIPKKEQLINDFKELKNFVQVGKKYGVSDNAVRKWCKKYKIGENEMIFEKLRLIKKKAVLFQTERFVVKLYNGTN